MPYSSLALTGCRPTRGQRPPGPRARGQRKVALAKNILRLVRTGIAAASFVSPPFSFTFSYAVVCLIFAPPVPCGNPAATVRQLHLDAAE
eukprot:636377-Prorocentrum_minimum.AAC.1